ncbi:MAG TPA: hypothetical protein VF451_03995 [Acidobacteriota bacterium]
MSKRMRWLVLVALLFWLGGCTRNSEAKVNVFNQGELETKITIYNSTAQIAPGKTATFTLSWPGRDSIHVSMASFPVAQPARAQYQDLELHHGDVLELNVEFRKN